jgi:hypothetical protein
MILSTMPRQDRSFHWRVMAWYYIPTYAYLNIRTYIASLSRGIDPGADAGLLLQRTTSTLLSAW